MRAFLRRFAKQKTPQSRAGAIAPIGDSRTSEFEEYVYRRFADSISSWPGPVADDVYAISFFVYDEDDDPDRPTVTLGYNTVERWNACTPRSADRTDIGWPVASDSQEAKWNYAFWLQNQEVVIGGVRYDPVDTEGTKLLSDWREANGLSGEAFTGSFVELCVRVARRLHEQGAIMSKFGREIPILVHELEYYDAIADQARRANPPGVATEFEDWVRGE